MRVIVIGAGVIGLTTAFYLQRSGHDVTVIERSDKVAGGCSHACGGILSSAYCLPWAGPNIPLQVVKSFFHSPSALRWRLDYSLQQLTWLWLWLRQCSAARHAIHRRRLLALAQYSNVCMAHVIRETNIRFFYATEGVLRVGLPRDGAMGTEHVRQQLLKLGIVSRRLSPEAQAVMEPGLESGDASSLDTLFIPQESTGRCEQFSAALMPLLQERGVQFLWGREISGLEIDGTTEKQLYGVNISGQIMAADAVVVAAGVGSYRLLKPYFRLPVYPVKGYSMTAPIIDTERAPKHGILDSALQLTITRFENEVRVCGFADLVGYRYRSEKDRCRQLRHHFETRYPNVIDNKQCQFWSGLRPVSADGVPLIGETPVAGLYLNVGHGAYGWTLACGSAHLLADIINETSPALLPRDYALTRFIAG